jgi:hypothetical protein
LGKNSQKSQDVHFQRIALSIFEKKNVAKCPGFSYVQRQLHHMVPGQTGFALRRVRRETRKTLTNNNKTTSEEPDEV